MNIPKHVKEWQEVYPEIPLEMFKCDCGKWYTSLDCFFPYHTEQNMHKGACNEHS